MFVGKAFSRENVRKSLGYSGIMYVFRAGGEGMLPVPKGSSYQLYPFDFLRSSY